MKCAPLVALLLAALAGCAGGRTARDPGAGRPVVAPPSTVCFDTPAPAFEAAVAAAAIVGDHPSCTFYPRFLRAADAWYLVGRPSDTEAYQFLYLPPFSRPVLVRVESARGRATLFAARLTWDGAADSLVIDRSVSRALSRAEWSKWEGIVARMGFWSETWPPDDGLSVCIDGDTYLFEGSRRARVGSGAVVRHKVWHPYCPRGALAEGLWEASSFLFALSATSPWER